MVEAAAKSGDPGQILARDLLQVGGRIEVRQVLVLHQLFLSIRK
jgi:hypothetical protein